MMVQIVEGGGMMIFTLLLQAQVILLQIIQQFPLLQDFILIITMLIPSILILGGQL